MECVAWLTKQSADKGEKILDFTLGKMQSMQKELQENYQAKWGGVYPEKGRSMLLWMIGEAGEVADIIKQNGDHQIMSDSDTRNHFVEEMCDVLMYFNDVMLCYNITEEELEQAYVEKHARNMKRW